MEYLQGKLIVRANATSGGKKALLVFGVLEYSGDVDSIDEHDEMWAVDLNINDIIKFSGNSDHEPTWRKSPEDILDDFTELTKSSKWNRKTPKKDG